MPRKIRADSSLELVEYEILFTVGALGADPDASDLASMTDGWLASLDAVRAKDREARARLAATDAARVVANRRLDGACVRFGDDLLRAVDKDASSARFRQFFAQPVSSFVKIALAKQVAKVQAWLGSADAVLERHRAPLTTWSKAAADALERTHATALLRGELRVVRERLAEDLTRERDGLHEALSARARERGLPRDWADGFFLVSGRAARGEEEASAPDPATAA